MIVSEAFLSGAPKERVAMKKMTGLKIGPVALLVLLALLTFLVVKRRGLTADEVEGDAVRVLFKVEDAVTRHEHAAVAFLAVIALFAFVMWTALRANAGEDKAVPAAKESSASGTAGSR
jgi:hypothetical protein